MPKDATDSNGSTAPEPGPYEKVLKQADARRRAADARADAILKATVDGVVVIDSTGRIQSVNPAVERIFGFAAEEMVGQNVKMLMPSPYRQEHDDYLHQFLTTGRRKIIGIGREVVGRRKGGATFPMDLAVSEVVLDEEIVFVGTIRDISGRKQLERDLRREHHFASSIVETAPAIVLVLDPQGCIVLFNQYFENLVGRPLEDIVGQDWVETFCPEGDPTSARQTFRRCLEGEPLPEENIHPLVLSSGEERSIEWHCRTLGADQKVTGVLAFGLDVTERQRLEAELRQAQKMEAVGQLAGGVAHDFNTILGSISGYSELLLKQLDPSSLPYRQTHQIRRAAERGASLTRQLLAFSRRRELAPSTVDLNSTVRSMTDMLKRLIGEDIELQVDLEAGLWPVWVDHDRFEQVIVNLVLNARDALGPNGRIDIATQNVPQQDVSAEGPLGPDSVVLTISDNGSGMDSATQDRIFEPFFTTKGPGEGTGLGLSMVYGTVKQSDGAISVHSNPQQGTSFEIVLPRTYEGSPVEEAVATQAAPPASRRETILVVEDDPIFLEMMRETLEVHGYRVLTAGRASEALELTEQARPAALITDVVMPEMSGIELADRLRSSHPRLRILLMSGYAEESLRGRGLECEISTVLQKPFKSSDLVQALRQVLHRPEKAAEGSE